MASQPTRKKSHRDIYVGRGPQIQRFKQTADTKREEKKANIFFLFLIKTTFCTQLFRYDKVELIYDSFTHKDKRQQNMN